jgi:transcriptional regulator with XRE-family HTH domain
MIQLQHPETLLSGGRLSRQGFLSYRDRGASVRGVLSLLHELVLDSLFSYDYTMKVFIESRFHTWSEDLMTTSISPKYPLPTPFTEALGQRIRDAREERGLSQMQLSERIERRQAAISDMENGRMQPDATTLVVLAQVLEKPVTYFFPPPWGPRVARGDLSYDEQALLLEFRRLQSDEHRQIAIALLTALAEQTTAS